MYYMKRKIKIAENRWENERKENCDEPSIALEAMEEMRLDKPELDSTMRNLVMGANGSYFEMWGSLNPGDDGRSDDEEGEGCEENDEDTVGVEELCDGERTTEENDGGTDEDVEGDQALHILSASSVLTSLVVTSFLLSTELESPSSALTNSS